MEKEKICCNFIILTITKTPLEYREQQTYMAKQKIFHFFRAHNFHLEVLDELIQSSQTITEIIVTLLICNCKNHSRQRGLRVTTCCRYLLHCWHCDRCLCVGDILLAPHLRHCFQLSVEVDSLQKLARIIKQKMCVKQLDQRSIKPLN